MYTLLCVCGHCCWSRNSYCHKYPINTQYYIQPIYSTLQVWEPAPVYSLTHKFTCKWNVDHKMKGYFECMHYWYHCTILCYCIRVVSTSYQQTCTLMKILYWQNITGIFRRWQSAYDDLWWAWSNFIPMFFTKHVINGIHCKLAAG